MSPSSALAFSLGSARAPEVVVAFRGGEACRRRAWKHPLQTERVGERGRVQKTVAAYSTALGMAVCLLRWTLFAKEEKKQTAFLFLRPG